MADSLDWLSGARDVSHEVLLQIDTNSKYRDARIGNIDILVSVSPVTIVLGKVALRVKCRVLRNCKFARVKEANEAQ